MNKNNKPREATSGEYAELSKWLEEEHGVDAFEHSCGECAVAVWDNYITDCPGYTGKVMIVIHSGAPSMFECFTWDASGKICKQECEIDGGK